MTDAVTKLPGTLFITSPSNEYTANIGLDIPPQVIRLKQYRVEMASDADAVAEGVLYLDIQGIYNSNKMIDTNVGRVYFPILLSGSAVTVSQVDLPISMTHHLPRTFPVRILNRSFEPVSDLVRASFLFEVSYGHSN